MGVASELIRRRHHEWREHHQRWRWLLDSLEGGERYRHAVYGYDSRGLPIRNLVRHKREYPDPREAAESQAGFVGMPAATDDDYELRLARTPVPTFLAEAIETHLARIYAREVKREGPARIVEFWNNVDGAGTGIDHWMSETVAPLLLVLGQLDICLDHPRASGSEKLETRADLLRLGLDRCLVGVILPQDMLWWKLDATNQYYEECLVKETCDEGAESHYRYWNDTESVLYDEAAAVLSVTPHAYGRVPIARLFDRRKARCQNIGMSRYEGVAERQREYYNRDSELILSDTTQAHPLLQGPEDYVQIDGTIPLGPSWLLPKKRNSLGTSVSYEGFEVINFPKEGAESIRNNKADLREEVDRDAALVRPTGRDGIALSGLAKMLDQYDGNNRLAKIARMLAHAEQAVAELALLVLGDGLVSPRHRQEIQVVYPTDFDLFTASDVAAATADFQAIVARSGALPETEGLLLSRLLRTCLPGLSDEKYAGCDREIGGYLADQARRRQQQIGEVGPPGIEQNIYADVHKWTE